MDTSWFRAVRDVTLKDVRPKNRAACPVDGQTDGRIKPDYSTQTHTHTNDPFYNSLPYDQWENVGWIFCYRRQIGCFDAGSFVVLYFVNGYSVVDISSLDILSYIRCLRISHTRVVSLFHLSITEHLFCNVVMRPCGLIQSSWWHYHHESLHGMCWWQTNMYYGISDFEMILPVIECTAHWLPLSNCSSSNPFDLSSVWTDKQWSVCLANHYINFVGGIVLV